MTSRPAPPSLVAPAPLAWILLDWAASAFSTILITLVVAYVEKVVFADGGWGVAGGVVWAWIIAATMLLSAVIAPWLSAWADRTHSHQRALLAAVAVGSGACLVLAAVPSTWRLAVAASIVVAGVGFDMGAIFAGSLLPRLAQGAAADRLSAAGFAGGYAGGAIALVLATWVVGARDTLGLSAADALRASFAIMGAWWLIFSLPALFVRMGDGHSPDHQATSTRELLAFARSLTSAADGRPLAAVLGGATLVMGAVQTAISQFSSVAIEDFRMEPAAVVRLVLLVQGVALPGALLMGWLSARWSRRGALALCLGGWAAVLVLAWFVRGPTHLHALAVLLALVLGGVQSVVRATVAGLAPRGRYGATFGLLQIGTKLAGFVASLAFGALYAASGHSRAGLLALLAQLVAGWWVLGYSRPSTSRIE